jgi:hypothetical protein
MSHKVDTVETEPSERQSGRTFGRTAGLIGAAATALAAVAASMPGTDYLIAGVSWLLALTAGGMLATRYAATRHTARRRWRQAIALAVLAACFGTATFTDLSLRARFAGAEPAMTAYAEDVMSGRKPSSFLAATPGESPLRFGTYKVDWVTRQAGYVEFVLSAQTVGITGFVYNPARLELAAHDPDDSYRRLTGPWYVMSKPGQ